MPGETEGTGDHVQEPSDALIGSITLVVQWKDLRGSRAIWDVIRRDVSKLDGVTLVGTATHWNALLQDLRSPHDEAVQLAILQFFSTKDQLNALAAAAARKAIRNGLPPAANPTVVNRQQLLILMRLAFEVARWDGSGAPVSRAELLDLLSGSTTTLMAFQSSRRRFVGGGEEPSLTGFRPSL